MHAAADQIGCSARVCGSSIVLCPVFESVMRPNSLE